MPQIGLLKKGQSIQIIYDPANDHKKYLGYSSLNLLVTFLSCGTLYFLSAHNYITLICIQSLFQQQRQCKSSNQILKRKAAPAN